MSGDFWTRRRNAVALEAETESRAVDLAEAKKTEAELNGISDKDILDKYDLPDPDTLDSPDAVKHFLSHALPERLKIRALRRLWRLNPVLANVDGLVDYGEDYTDAATVIEGMQTAYQVGKGMLAHVDALADEADPEAAALTGQNDTATDEDTIFADLASEQTHDVAPAQVQAPTPEALVEDVPEDLAVPPSRTRRMIFQFET